MKIYTRTGDKGETGLFGSQRVSKSSLRMHAYGTVDELNACLGLILADASLPQPLQTQLQQIQLTLFSIGSDLATPLESTANIHRTTAEESITLEQWIDAMEESLPPLKRFIRPGGSPVGAQLHLARTICRRAERWIVELHESQSITQAIIIYINRLSDFLFVAARFTNALLGHEEETIIIARE